MRRTLAPLFAALLLWIAGTEDARAARGFDDDVLRQRVEDQGRRVVEAVNAPDSMARQRLASQMFSPGAVEKFGQSRLAALFARLADRFGALEYHHSEAYRRADADVFRAVLHVYARGTRDGGWHDLQFLLQPEPPHAIEQIVFVADVAEPVYLPNGDLTDPGTREWLGEYVDRLVAENDLAGGLLVAKGDRVLFERSFGFADSARRTRIGPQTRFGMASGSKMFTALVLAQLAGEGKVRFDDPLTTYLPKLASHDFARRVTLRQLLSHASGVGEYWTDEFDRHRSEVRTTADFLPWVLRAGTTAAPGERHEYSNSNFILAGLVIEAVTGQPIPEVVRERILGPLGMDATGYDDLRVPDSLRARPLVRGPGGWSATGHVGGGGSAAGGATTTMADMLRFARTLVTGRVVPRPMLEQLTAAQPPEAGDGRYGLGFLLEGRDPASRSFGHGGIARGVNFECRYFPQHDVTLIAFSNQDNGAYDDLRRNAIKLITGER